MLISIQQPEFFPWLGFFNKISQVEKVVLLDTVQFKKRYFENRNKIRTAQDWCWVRVPVKSKGRYEQLIREVEIDDNPKWRGKLVSTIRLAYTKAPYWCDGGDELCDLIGANKSPLLVDFNVDVISFLMRRFNLVKPIVLASELAVDGSGSQLILDICKAMNASEYLSGRDGKNYLDEDEFAGKGISINFQEFEHPHYQQFQQGEFIPAMSAIDLLFNVGEDVASKMISAPA